MKEACTGFLKQSCVKQAIMNCGTPGKEVITTETNTQGKIRSNLIPGSLEYLTDEARAVLNIATILVFPAIGKW
jgi:hypothetical protein